MQISPLKRQGKGSLLLPCSKMPFGIFLFSLKSEFQKRCQDALEAPPGISMCHRHLESFEPDSVRRAHSAGPTGDDAKNKKGPLLRSIKKNNAVSRPSRARNGSPGISRCHRHLESFEPDSVRCAHRAGPTGDDAKNKKPVLTDWFFIFGGATRNRTGDRGVADLCLTAWPWRRSFERKYYTTIPLFCQSFFQKSFKFIFDTVFLSPGLNRPRAKAPIFFASEPLAV